MLILLPGLILSLVGRILEAIGELLSSFGYLLNERIKDGVKTPAEIRIQILQAEYQELRRTELLKRLNNEGL